MKSCGREGPSEQKVKVGSLVAAAALCLSSFLPLGPASGYDLPPLHAAVRPLAYSVEASEPPCLVPRSREAGEASMLRNLASKAKVVLLGDHGGSSEEDSVLEERMLARLARERGSRPLRVMLFQDEATLMTQADRLQKAVGVPVEAVSLSALGSETLQAEQQEEERIIQQLPQYQDYEQEVLDEQFERKQPSNEKVSRFREEARVRQQLIAQKISNAYLQDPAHPLVVAILPLEDVEFGYGVRLRVLHKVLGDDIAGGEIGAGGVYSMIANPTAADTFSQLVGLKLSLNFHHDLFYVEEKGLKIPGPEVLASYGIGESSNSNRLADYIYFTQSPSIKLLIHLKNPVDREGSKPPGEDSVLGVF
eukprot:gene7123-7876_t